MSIYGTIGEFRLPVLLSPEKAQEVGLVAPNEPIGRMWGSGDDEEGDGRPCLETWVLVLIQCVPAHIQDTGPGWDFLPPPVEDTADGPARAILFVRAVAGKGTARNPQEYRETLLCMTGAEYRAASFGEVLWRVQEALDTALGR